MRQEAIDKTKVEGEEKVWRVYVEELETIRERRKERNEGREENKDR